MKRPVLFAFLVAIPIEAVNCFLLAPPIDVGLPDYASRFEKLVALQWVILHWPGLQAPDWLGSQLGIFVLFASGYLDTVLLLIAFIFAFRWVRCLVGRLLEGSADQSAS
jgi:hypothetical protein